ncbi:MULTISPECIES: FKBP-type peptidyl-prolyl cis-trans isomerase [unclassified Arcicella]|uniref:FKBP-type peptidyl-prolyl cis-trans isomerase n=1 Tax=unclassified Arcicella TaxID=2644986 RepID=UPI0028616001|nr:MULTISPECIES: FKBP-type peptidyl-prolyl cis-trans isomerase [unclassified Arcicella]MDR6563663.1 FKBP-type peptidyl-prolyl cis-trans isomerase [Arcicella sp. BE51]MDR6814199.1 FKBP-type peptidyl-prolyl cis-trans isomerase [Arcicella sp. BE140]MDR6825562.1 FKBP-type peptidyl-prolyl cis-trans isomerase [Arcicella sp. BE139]
MMKFKLLNLLVFGALVCMLSSCLSTVVLEENVIDQQNETQIQQYISSKSLTMQKASNGVYYAINKANPSGRQIILGDTISVHYVITRLDGVKIDSSSVLTNKPFTFYHNGVNTNIFLKFLYLMHEGETGSFILPSRLVGAGVAFPNLAANQPVRCDISYFYTFGEEADIDHYIAKNKITVTEKTTEGVRYIKTRDGSADLISGKVAKIKYTGKFLSGEVFDTNVGKTDSLSLTVGSSSTSFVTGFVVGINKMKLGEKATLIFRSALGYGSTGNTTIPPYTPLIFEVEIVALKDQ